MKTPVVIVSGVAFALLLGCGRTSLTPESPCAHTLCPRPYVCDPEDGTCKVPAPEDAGQDAGVSDAGFLDAGLDAGTDGGLVPCANGCPPERFCDASANGGAGACVVCTATVGCAGPTPACDTTVSGGQCVGCLDDLDCASPTPTCDLPSRTCVECTSDVQCGGLTPFCNLGKHSCAQCASNADCSGQLPICDLQLGACRGCSSDSECANPTPVCEPVTQSCVACTASSQCGPGEICFGGSCGPVPDTCSTAQLLTFPIGSNTLTFQADTSTAGDDEFGTCNPQGGRELIYRLTLTGPTALMVTATRAGGNANPAVYLRSGSCSGTQIACANSSPFSETVTAPNLGAGDYFIFIESRGGSAGPLDVTVKATPLGPPPVNDDCAGAQPLVFVNGAATALGSTSGATNSNGPNVATPTCSASARQTGSDVVYEFTLTQPRDVTLTVTPTGTGTTFRPALYVRGPSTVHACSSDSQLGCASAGNGSISPQTLLLPNLAAGTYYVWVDGVLDSTGAFQLDLTTSSPTSNDTCASPKALSFTNGVATAAGDTRFAGNDNAFSDTSPTCSNSAKVSGRDVVFSYTLAQPQDVTLTVTPNGPSPSFQPVLYVRAPQCGVTTSANELACQSSFTATPQTVSLFNQPPGTYFVWVDGAQQTDGPFTLTATLGAPTPQPPNDTCTAPNLLAIGVPMMGDTTTATDSYSRNSLPSYSFACTSNNNLPFTGRDLVYQFTATSTQHTITVTPSLTFDPAVLLLSQQCSPTACTTFVDAQGTGAAEVLTANTVPGATYAVVVDAFIASQQGAFTIQVQ